MQLLQKENILILVIVICALLYWKGKQIKQSKVTQEIIKWLPVLGGLAYGFNTLIQVS